MAQPISAPTLVTPSKQRTILQYLVKRRDLDNPKEVEPTSSEEFCWPEEFDATTTDTPPSEFATPGEQSPETVGEGSADEADTTPPWSGEATSDILARMNTYKYVRMVDLEKLDLNERHGYELYKKSVEQTTTMCTVLNEGSPDTQGLSEQPRDVTPPKEDTVRFDWRVDLRDHSLRYDSLVEQTGQRGGGQAATRDLRCWSDDDRTAPGQRKITPWRGRLDSPVSHHNLWDRKEGQWDTPGGQATVGVHPSATPRRECMMGGGDITLVTPPT